MLGTICNRCGAVVDQVKPEGWGRFNLSERVRRSERRDEMDVYRDIPERPHIGAVDVCPSCLADIEQAWNATPSNA